MDIILEALRESLKLEDELLGSVYAACNRNLIPAMMQRIQELRDGVQGYAQLSRDTVLNASADITSSALFQLGRFLLDPRINPRRKSPEDYVRMISQVVQQRSIQPIDAQTLRQVIELLVPVSTLALQIEFWTLSPSEKVRKFKQYIESELARHHAFGAFGIGFLFLKCFALGSLSAKLFLSTPNGMWLADDAAALFWLAWMATRYRSQQDQYKKGLAAMLSLLHMGMFLWNMASHHTRASHALAAEQGALLLPNRLQEQVGDASAQIDHNIPMAYLMACVHTFALVYMAFRSGAGSQLLEAKRKLVQKVQTVSLDRKDFETMFLVTNLALACYVDQRQLSEEVSSKTQIALAYSAVSAIAFSRPSGISRIQAGFLALPFAAFAVFTGAHSLSEKRAFSPETLLAATSLFAAGAHLATLGPAAQMQWEATRTRLNTLKNTVCVSARRHAGNAWERWPELLSFMFMAEAMPLLLGMSHNITSQGVGLTTLASAAIPFAVGAGAMLGSERALRWGQTWLEGKSDDFRMHKGTWYTLFQMTSALSLMGRIVTNTLQIPQHATEVPRVLPLRIQIAQYSVASTRSALETTLRRGMQTHIVEPGLGPFGPRSHTKTVTEIDQVTMYFSRKMTSLLLNEVYKEEGADRYPGPYDFQLMPSLLQVVNELNLAHGCLLLQQGVMSFDDFKMLIIGRMATVPSIERLIKAVYSERPSPSALSFARVMEWMLALMCVNHTNGSFYAAMRKAIGIQSEDLWGEVFTLAVGFRCAFEMAFETDETGQSVFKVLSDLQVRMLANPDFSPQKLEDIDKALVRVLKGIDLQRWARQVESVSSDYAQHITGAGLDQHTVQTQVMRVNQTVWYGLLVQPERVYQAYCEYTEGQAPLIPLFGKVLLLLRTMPLLLRNMMPTSRDVAVRWLLESRNGVIAKDWRAELARGNHKESFTLFWLKRSAERRAYRAMTACIVNLSATVLGAGVWFSKFCLGVNRVNFSPKNCRQGVLDVASLGFYLVAACLFAPVWALCVLYDHTVWFNAYAYESTIRDPAFIQHMQNVHEFFESPYVIRALKLSGLLSLLALGVAYGVVTLGPLQWGILAIMSSMYMGVPNILRFDGTGAGPAVPAETGAAGQGVALQQEEKAHENLHSLANGSNGADAAATLPVGAALGVEQGANGSPVVRLGLFCKRSHLVERVQEQARAPGI